MRRLVRLPLFLAALAAVPAGLVQAQENVGTYVQVRVSANYNEAVFWVDGYEYKGSMSFLWPEGSKHILEMRVRSQFPRNDRERLDWSGWTETVSSVSLSDPKWNITATGKTAHFLVNFSHYYKVCYNFPAQRGEVTIDDKCVPSSTCSWYAEGATAKMMATPYPGYAFVSWNITGFAIDTAFFRTQVINAPYDIQANLVEAHRIRFMTSPPGLNVLVDRTTVRTRIPDVTPCLPGQSPDSYPDPENPNPPIGVPAPSYPYYKCGGAPQSGQVPLCTGEFDFVPGSKHVLSAPPMQSLLGKTYVFQGWEAGGAQNALFETPALPGTTVLTARFTEGYTALFDTKPTGLKLVIDGRESGTQASFAWGLGMQHTAAAPAEQTGADGRRYRFVNWSDNAPRERTVQLDAQPGSGLRLVANYEALGRLVVQTDPQGLPLEVAGAACRAPCTVERAAGEVVTVKAPAGNLLTPENRQEFTGWEDGGDAARQVSMTTAIQTLTARYRTLYKLSVFLDPPDGVDVTTEPAAGDNWFAAATRVNVTARARAGFRFRNWEGDLAGSVPSGTLVMSAPRAIAAHLDRIPHLPESAVESAAGPTPEAVVAPGSLIVINGKNIAAATEAGPGNPLVQTLAGVTVQGSGMLYPLVSVTPDRIVAQLPAATGSGERQLTVARTGQPSVTTSFQVARNAPGLMVNYDYEAPVALAAREDGTRVAPANPPAVNETVTLYGTGFGPFQTTLPDGFGAPNGMRLALADGIELLADGVPIPYLWCGAPAELPGLVIVQFKVPPPTEGKTGFELRVRVGGRESNTVRLPVGTGEPKPAATEGGGDQ